ncbi:MAG: YfhO family protein [Verrucomicrobia bacterium]|nr:YfhO family protein [Verrucomicrobiota bacterium]
MDFLAVSHVTAPGEVMKFVTHTGRLAWATIGQRPIFTDAAATLHALASPDFKPEQEVFLPLEAKSFVTATNQARAKVVKTSFSTRRVELEVEAAEPALLVIAQCWYPSWRAEVDDKPTKLWRANHAFQALEVPAGAKRVVLEYRERWFGFGVGITLATLLACATIWFRSRGAQSGSL